MWVQEQSEFPAQAYLPVSGVQTVLQPVPLVFAEDVDLEKGLLSHRAEGSSLQLAHVKSEGNRMSSPDHLLPYASSVHCLLPHP